MKTRLLYAILIPVLLIVALQVPARAQQADIPSATIHLDKTGDPVHPFIYGMFTELLFNMFENGIWAEMLSDRKFFYPVDTSTELVPKNTKRHQNRWRPVGPLQHVIMDTRLPYAGKQSPEIIIDEGDTSGIRQAGMWLRSGKIYTGNIVLCGDESVRVDITLVWGKGENDTQKITVDRLTKDYRKYFLHFTANGDTDNGYIEITGTGKGSFHIGAVSLMPADNLHGFRKDMVEILKGMNSGIYRWPGGNFVANYEWRHGIGDRDRRPPRYDYAWNTVESNDVGTDEFLTLCELIHVEPYICVNIGFGDAYSAAQWVEYCNGPMDSPMGMLRAANGHPEPYGVKYWGIGNEMYGEWQLGHMSAYHFTLKHNLFAEYMLEKDPTIKLTGSGATLYEAGTTARHHRPPLHARLPYDYMTPDDWSGTLLKGCMHTMDYLAEHIYPYFEAYFDADRQEWINYDDSLLNRLRKLPNRVKGMVECMEEYNTRIPGLEARGITFWLDEWTGGWRGFEGTLGAALGLHEMFRQSHYITMAAYTGFSNLYSADDVDAVISSKGLLFRLYRDRMGTIPIAVTGNQPQKEIRGTAGVDKPAVSSGSDTYPLDVAATMNPEKTRTTVAIVNATKEAQMLNLAFQGGKTGSQAVVCRMTAEDPMAENRPGEEPVITVRENRERLSSRIEIPSLSITLYEIDLK